MWTVREDMKSRNERENRGDGNLCIDMESGRGRQVLVIRRQEGGGR